MLEEDFRAVQEHLRERLWVFVESLEEDEQIHQDFSPNQSEDYFPKENGELNLVEDGHDLNAIPIAGLLLLTLDLKVEQNLADQRLEELVQQDHVIFSFEAKGDVDLLEGEFLDIQLPPKVLQKAEYFEEVWEEVVFNNSGGHQGVDHFLILGVIGGNVSMSGVMAVALQDALNIGEEDLGVLGRVLLIFDHNWGKNRILREKFKKIEPFRT